MNLQNNAAHGLIARLVDYFQQARITPLLALVLALLGVFAMLVTPREEEPQIDVTMANVLIAFPAASVEEVEHKVAGPAEQMLMQIAGVEHVMSASYPGMAVLTVQFKVGVAREQALVRLHDAVSANADLWPPALGVQTPLIKPKGIDDVPVLALTLYAQRADTGVLELEQIAHSLEAELQRVPGVREVKALGAPGAGLQIELDTLRLNASGLSVAEVAQALRAAHGAAPVGELLRNNQSVRLETSAWLQSAQEVEELVLSVRQGKPVFLRDVATVRQGAPLAAPIVQHFQREAGGVRQYPALTLAISKKPGANASSVALALQERVSSLRNILLPAGVEYAITRDYGASASAKANKLLQKLAFATLSVVALVWLTLGWRAAAIVGSAVLLTLTATLFASWAWGFTLNRVSLFALIFSIGILVDDAIVVVENIHRHQQLQPEASLLSLIPGAVAEVGGPTILATFTVIAALLPMAFVSGLMGPYMSPIPINASLGMLLSLLIAFIISPWLARLWLGRAHSQESRLEARLHRGARSLFAPLLAESGGRSRRRLLWLGLAGLIALALSLPLLGAVTLKMLPFDNKSEFQAVLDMPPDTPVEKTNAVLQEMAMSLLQDPVVTQVQSYAGSASPINFNGLVRQYYLRNSQQLGDLQVMLRSEARKEQSHAIAARLRPQLQAIAARHGGRLKVAETPPGPPVQAPIVAEIYGPDLASRRQFAAQVAQVFQQTPGVVDVDWSMPAEGKRKILILQRARAQQLGLTPATVLQTLQTLLQGQDVAWLADASRHPHAMRLQLDAAAQGDLAALLQLQVRSESGRMIALSEVLQVQDAARELPRYHKDLLPYEFVLGDVSGGNDSPLYSMFAMRGKIAALRDAAGASPQEYFISQPSHSWQGLALKWDGEAQITYETFRDMGAAYAVGLILIYLLVVAHFGSYSLPLIIMAPIPLTIVGVLPGHALLGAQFTATSMIGMIALAGIIVRNSILLVDFIRLQTAQGMPLAQAIPAAASTRAQPIMLTALAAMLGAFFILDDPIFNGLAIALIFGILVSTLLTLLVIPLLYFIAYRE
ncbi:efflux RND transporter permease subunit [Massilia sp. W12]|uniref:efflux RND transporter permease subunit n=1 Tax=Massilia sp. W12 TaxID=3126507 RepID=UPI0030D03289